MKTLFMTKRRWLVLIPVCFLVNFFAGIDRSIISVTLAGGMEQDLALNATMVGLITGVVSIGLMVLCIPGGHLAQKGNIKKLLGVAMFGWSVLSLATGFATEAWQLIIIRFLLGVCEGAISPGITTLLTFWFPDRNGERNRAISAYLMSSSFAMVLMGPIAGVVLTFATWNELFIGLGVLSFFTLLMWILFAHDRPSDARWLTEEERTYINTCIAEEREQTKHLEGSGEGAVTDTKFHLSLLLTNKYVWLLMGIGFCLNIGQNGFSMWLPTAIKEITAGNIMTVGLLTALPTFCTIIGLWIWSFITSRIKSRRFAVTLPLVLFGLCMMLPSFIGDAVGVIGNLALLCLIASFIQGVIPALYTIPSLVLVKELDGSARGMMAFCMNLGQFVGPYGVGILITMTGSNHAGYLFMGAMLIIGGLIALAFPKMLGAENMNRDDETAHTK